MPDIKFGIDFGTTNSACVGIVEGRSEIRIGDGYSNPFPSLIAVDKFSGNQVYYGRDVWFRRQELGESCIIFSSIKNYLGTDWTKRIQNVEWLPEMVAAEIFQGLKKQAQEQSSVYNINRAVVAVPVGFLPEKRAKLRVAARAAGIEIESFVNEPTAALFYHLDEVWPYSKVGVIDWGGGTLDVSIVELGAQENGFRRVSELQIGGLKLGGDDIDMKVAEWAHSQIIMQKKADIPFSEMPPSSRDLLITRCEMAKKALTDEDLVDIRLNRYGDLGKVNIGLHIETLDQLTSNYVDQVIKCFEETLNRAGLSIADLGCVLMIGGSVQLRPFSDAVESRWNCYKFYPDDSDWSVARGAAALATNPGQYTLSSGIGVLLSDSSFYPLLEKGNKINGEKRTYSFGLIEDSNTASFIFTDHRKNALGYLEVPAFGFFQEKINLETHVDKDLIFWAKAKSNNRSDEYERKWSYSSMALDYYLPVSARKVRPR